MIRLAPLYFRPMASIRRTLSPAYHDRNNSRHPNGAVHSPLFLSSSSPSHKLFSAAVKSNAKREAFLGRRSLYRCLLFFVLGIVLGIFPFGHVVDRAHLNDAQSGDDASLVLRGSPDVSTLEINPPQVEAKRDDFSLSAVSLGSVEDRLSDRAWDHAPPPGRQLIVVTPTYPRAGQAYFLSRLGQLLKLVAPPVVWIVVEGGEGATAETAEVLRRTGVMYRHLVTGKKAAEEANNDRGVHQRNAALQHIERHRLDGIVYFADDDNVYSLELFQRLRDINRFGTWPVAMLAQSKNKAILEGPVCNGSQVIGWHTNEKSKRLRRFHVDMSGFAFNSTILWDPKRWGRPFLNPIRQLDKLKEGFQETTFIEQVVEDESQMEGVPPGCSKILNWHLHLDVHGLVYPRGWLLQKNLDVVIPIK